MSALITHLAYALRALRRSPAFAITAVVTLALGIGATTAIFSVANAVLLRTLPYPGAERLVLVWGELRARNVRDFPMAPADFADLRTDVPGFEELAAVIPVQQPLRSDAYDPEQVSVALVTANLLSMLGGQVAIGRGFIPEDAAPQPPPPGGFQAGPGQPGAAQPPGPPPLPQMVILSDALWRRRYGGDPGIVGKRIDLGFGGAEVVGVLAPGFEMLWPAKSGIEVQPDVFSALRADFAAGSRINVSLRVVGRTKPGVPLAAINAQLEELSTRLREQFAIKKTADSHLYAEPMHNYLVEGVRPAIITLLGAVGFVLLIACANVANLLLVRTASRERELAVRAALGGSRARIAVPLLAEVLVIALGGALLGLLLAHGGIRLLVSMAPENLPRLGHVGIDPLVLGFTMLVTILAALVFGMTPVLRGTRFDLSTVLRAGRTAGAGAGRAIRNGVVIAEVAMAFVLLVGGGLLMRSFVELQRSAPGFDPSGMLTFQAGLQAPEAEARAGFSRQLGERLRALPGVVSATAANPLPLSGGVANARWGTEAAAADPASFQQADVRVVLPGYFQAMGTRLIAGRAFTDEDNRQERTGIIIDRILAAKAFPNASAVGRQLLVRVRTQEPELLQVIGVVDHQRHETLAADGREQIYLTDAFMGTGGANQWAVRLSCADGTECDPNSIAPAVKRIVAELDPRTPVSEMQPMQVFVDRAMATTRFSLALVAIFAGIAALLACVGLYGVLATTVRLRTNELGVRLALGAPTASVFRLVIGEGLKLTSAGIVVGLVAAFAVTRLLQSLLVGVAPTDPVTFGGVILLFIVVATVACWIPSRRAASMDPLQALRQD